MLEEGKRKGSAMNIDIAQRLYELRRDHGYSQESLAEALEISRQAISKWERAESAPDMGNLIALADLYGITIDELVRPESASEGESGSNEEVEAEDTVEQDGQEAAAHVVQGSPDAPGDATEATEQTVISDAPVPPKDRESAYEDAKPKKPEEPEKPVRLRCGLRRFPYPLFIVVLLLFLTFVLGMWEYVWLFLTIPFYYWIARIIERDPKYREAHGFPPYQ